MPMEKSASDGATKRNFEEFRKGKTFKRTAGKHGKSKARKQMIAAVLSNKRKSAAKGNKRNSTRKKGR